MISIFPFFESVDIYAIRSYVIIYLMCMKICIFKTYNMSLYILVFVMFYLDLLKNNQYVKKNDNSYIIDII
jgi:hypothetical protein